MIGLLQRVQRASVDVEGERVAAIEQGLLVLVCAERGDTTAQGDRLLERLLGYRVFADDTGRMNRSLAQLEGDLLLVPQFTLAADTTKGTRPSFSRAAAPEDGARLFAYVLAQATARHAGVVQSGRFGADMQVALVNDGPVTFWLRTTSTGPS
ncbi:MAG: D-aminoacyl-tRNA deacylase [Pseudomonadota bacterium]